MKPPWTKAAIRKPSPLWVFGYGSLMWRPGFDYLESRKARIFGYHRALCVRSENHRGTIEKPGLVVGLDFGGSCQGRAFRVAPAKVRQVTAYLDERERITGIYEPIVLPAQLENGQIISCYTFRVRRRHPQYVRRVNVEEAQRQIQSAEGMSGACRDYLANTIDHLKVFGLRDPMLCRLARPPSHF